MAAVSKRLKCFVETALRLAKEGNKSPGAERERAPGMHVLSFPFGPCPPAPFFSYFTRVESRPRCPLFPPAAAAAPHSRKEAKWQKRHKFIH